MPKRVAITTLNATTVDILNTIRQNASYEYQSLVPKISKATEIPQVGEVLYGYPALANQALSQLINRIASVRVKSAVFNNAYAQFKKGYLEFGETVEEVFVNITKCREFSAEKAESRELKRTIPDVKSAFHTMNWRVQYPITIQDEDFRMAFLSAEGVQDLIARIVDAIYTAAEYDEYLLFKYLIIKGIAGGKFFPVQIKANDIEDAAINFRGFSNMLTFMKTDYNATGVHTVTPREDQLIIMDSMYNAQFDVQVLASAFNMDKATFLSRLMLVDDWTTFDNERFETIRTNSDAIEEVTAAELALLQNVKAVIVDKEWFQVYDNQNKFTEKYVASGEYWNYFYNVWKTVSYSPFSNAIVFVESPGSIALPASITTTVTDVSQSEIATVVTLTESENTPALAGGNLQHVQTKDATEKGIAVHPYGAYIFPPNSAGTIPEINVTGTVYVASATFAPANAIPDEVVTFNKKS